jgi:cell division protein ZapA
VSTPAARVSVSILEKEYVVACADGERAALLEAAELVSARMLEVRDSGRVLGTDRIAVMVALNLANEFLQLRRREVKLDSAVAQIRSLRERVQAALETDLALEGTSSPGALPLSGYTPP